MDIKELKEKAVIIGQERFDKEDVYHTIQHSKLMKIVDMVAREVLDEIDEVLLKDNGSIACVIDARKKIDNILSQIEGK